MFNFRDKERMHNKMKRQHISHIKRAKIFSKGLWQGQGQYEPEGVTALVLSGCGHCGSLLAESAVTLLFCLGRKNGLILEEGQRCLHFPCDTCPYMHKIPCKVTNRKYPKLKEVDDEVGGAAAWET